MQCIGFLSGNAIEQILGFIKLMEMRMSLADPLIDNLICIVLNFPVSFTTRERSSSVQNTVKNRPRGLALGRCLLIDIEKRIARSLI